MARPLRFNNKQLKLTRSIVNNNHGKSRGKFVNRNHRKISENLHIATEAEQRISSAHDGEQRETGSECAEREMDNKADFTKQGHEKGCAAAAPSSLIASERGPPAVRDWRGRERRRGEGA